MAVRRTRLLVAAVPPPRPPAKLPPPRRVGAAPGGQPPKGHTPTVYVATAPLPRAAGKPPNPKRLTPVHGVDGRGLGDLFAIFPDLPRPAHPPTRRARMTAVVRGRRRRPR